MDDSVRQMVIAYLNGENVEYESTRSTMPWTKVNSLSLFEDLTCCFRIAPPTVKIGGVEVPRPSFTGDGYCINIDVKPSLVFKTNEDRRTFWHALCGLVKE